MVTVIQKNTCEPLGMSSFRATLTIKKDMLASIGGRLAGFKEHSGLHLKYFAR